MFFGLLSLVVIGAAVGGAVGGTAAVRRRNCYRKPSYSDDTYNALWIFITFIFDAIIRCSNRNSFNRLS